MSKKFLEVGDTDADAFAKASGEQRRALRKRRIWEAEWNRDPTPVGEVVFHMRERARASQARAFGFLVLLFVSVLAGLVYFVAVPIYRDWVARQANDARLEAEAALNSDAATLAGTFEQLKAESTAVALDIWRGDHQNVDLRSVHFLDDRTGWIAGNTGSIFSTTDGGESWVLRETGTSADLFSVMFVDAQNGWAVGRLGTILASSDGGATWERQNSQSSEQLNAVRFVDAQRGWALGTGGVIVATTDGGASWVRQKSDTDATLLSVHFTNANIGWAVGTGNTVLRTDDGGVNWVMQGIGSDRTFRSVDFVNEQTGWIASEQAIYATRNAGETWTKLAVRPTDDFFTAIDLIDEEIGWAIDWDGGLQSTVDGGGTWSQHRNPGIFITSLSFRDSGLGWFVGDSGQIFKISGGGERVEVQSLPVPDVPSTAADWIGGPIVEASDAFALQTAIVRSGIRIGNDERAPEYQAELSALLGKQAALEKSRAALPAATTTLADQAVDVAKDAVAKAETPESREAAMAVFDAALRQKANENAWWQKLDEQIPAGILLLFLLATLGSLYRYNTRIAGFYHGRADALELMAQEVSEAQLEKMANALGADQVEFKQTKTPADMATEVAKEVISKLQLKPGA